MLRMTDDAATLVCTLTANLGTSADGGLRVIVDPVHHSLSMGISEIPAASDVIVSNGAARVFLSPVAAQRLEKRTLRADLSKDRSVFFLDR
jgi:hypothetical protein